MGIPPVHSTALCPVKCSGLGLLFVIVTW